MAVTITGNEVANSIRVDYAETDVASLVDRLVITCSLIVVETAPFAPDAVHNEACVRLVGYLFDQPNAPAGGGYANALRNSGADALLNQYKSLQAQFAEDTGATPAPSGGGEFLTIGEATQLIRNLIEEHRLKPNAHHTPPDVSNFITDAQSETIADTKIATHNTADDAHATEFSTAKGANEAFTTAAVKTHNESADAHANQFTNYPTKTDLTDSLLTYVTEEDLQEALTGIGATVEIATRTLASTSVIRNRSYQWNRATETISLEAGTYLIDLLATTSGNRVKLGIDDADGNQLLLLVGNANGSIHATRLLVLTSDTVIHLFAQNGAGQTRTISDIKLTALNLVPSGSSGGDVTKAQFDILKEQVNSNAVLLGLTQDQTVRLHKTPGTPAVIANTTRAGLLIHNPPPPTNTHGVVKADAPAQGWTETNRVFVRLHKSESRANYQVVFKVSGQEDFDVLGTSWELLPNLVSETFDFYLAWNRGISNQVDTIELQSGLGNTTYDGEFANDLITPRSLRYNGNHVVSIFSKVNIAEFEPVHFDNSGTMQLAGNDFTSEHVNLFPNGIALEGVSINNYFEVLVDGVINNVTLTDYIAAFGAVPRPVYYRATKSNGSNWTLDIAKATVPHAVGIWSSLGSVSGTSITGAAVQFNFSALSKWILDYEIGVRNLTSKLLKRILPETIGAADTVLTSDGTDAVWKAGSGGGGGGIETAIFYNATSRRNAWNLSGDGKTAFREFLARDTLRQFNMTIVSSRGWQQTGSIQITENIDITENATQRRFLFIVGTGVAQSTAVRSLYIDLIHGNNWQIEINAVNIATDVNNPTYLLTGIDYG